MTNKSRCSFCIQIGCSGQEGELVWVGNHNRTKISIKFNNSGYNTVYTPNTLGVDKVANNKTGANSIQFQLSSFNIILKVVRGAQCSGALEEVPPNCKNTAKTKYIIEGTYRERVYYSNSLNNTTPHIHRVPNRSRQHTDTHSIIIGKHKQTAHSLPSSS